MRSNLVEWLIGIGKRISKNPGNFYLLSEHRMGRKFRFQPGLV